MFWHLNKLTRGFIYKHKNFYSRPPLVLLTVSSFRSQASGHCVEMHCSLALSLKAGGCSAHLSCLSTYNCAWHMVHAQQVLRGRMKEEMRSNSCSRFLPVSLCCICVSSQWATVGGAGSPAPLLSGLTTAMQANGQSQALKGTVYFCSWSCTPVMWTRKNN